MQDVHALQPEVSNEPPLRVEGVEWPPPLPDDLLLDAGAPPAGDDGAGSRAGETDGAGWDGGGAARGASREALGASVAAARTGEDARAGAGATRVDAGSGADGLRGRTPAAAGAAEGISIGAASLRRTGIAALTEAVGRLDGASARDAPLVSIARPIAKKQANTAHTDPAAMGTARSTRAPARPTPSRSLSMRALLISRDMPSAWSQSDQGMCRRVRGACRYG